MSQIKTSNPPIKRKDQVDSMLDNIEGMRTGGTMPDDSYYKCIVCLAYEYIQIDEAQKGLVLISKIPPSYFKDIQPTQVKEDKPFGEIVVLLAYRLIQMGVVVGETEVYNPTQAQGQA